jgi:uncharacterized protein (TIGR03000 family)
MGKYLLAMVLGVAGMLMTPGESHAQRWGRGGGWGRAGWNRGGWNTGWNGGWNRPGWNAGWGRPGWGGGWGGPAIAWGGTISPTYADYGSYPSYAYGSNISPTASTSFYYSPPDGASASMADKATVQVDLPANAQLFVDGQPTTQTGDKRTLETPPMVVGPQFTYELRAHWMKDGKPVDETRTVTLSAGSKQVVDFNKKADSNKEQAPEPRKKNVDSNKEGFDPNKKPADFNKDVPDSNKKPADSTKQVPDKKPVDPDKE